MRLPGDGEVLVRLAYSGINFMDIHTRQGKYVTSQTHPQTLPTTLGIEGVGMIEAISVAASTDFSWATGSPIACRGGVMLSSPLSTPGESFGCRRNCRSNWLLHQCSTASPRIISPTIWASSAPASAVSYMQHPVVLASCLCI